MHARDALILSPDRLSAEMNCLLWVLRSLKDLRLETVSIGFAVTFQVESRGSNKVATEIAKSVLRDGQLQSYLALGGPSWLHDLIQTEVALVDS
ncbi:BnaC03g46880D [Brassica napus]|uniref:BnaC03g46880D protein n=1 Tax=Brassica napus TaxID=3708 RepID=A0A078H2X6_BRANA|nr:BnaC03g46880D [Brassica napus]